MSATLSTLFGRVPGGWAPVVAKYGPSWVLLAWMIWFLTAGIGADIRSGLADHKELGFYLRQICLGINSGNADAWSRCQPPAAH